MSDHKPGEAVLLVGEVLESSVGTHVNCNRKPSVVLQELLDRASVENPDAWFIGGEFEGNVRKKAAWIRSTAISIDLDFEDPELSRENGAHQDLPESVCRRILAGLGAYTVPALAYMTKRGMRLIHILSEDVHDLGEYEEVARAAAESVLRHLGAHGVPLWRDGIPGLRYDETSGRPSQPMRLPLHGLPHLTCGEDRPVRESELRLDEIPRLDLSAALPEAFADACQRVGDWIQIACEVVVVGLLARVAAAIGNTTWVEVRGFRVPLSLHVLNVLPPGSGKSGVRRFLRMTTQGIEDDVKARRTAAAQELLQHQQALEEWKSARRRKNGAPGERPVAPEVPPEGGARTSYTLSEATLEGVVATLEDTPRGVLWSTDEAHEVLGLLGRSGEGGSARSLDAARLRRLMDSDPVEVHRARSNVSSVRSLPVPWLGIEADVQPGVFTRLFLDEDRDSGLVARVLMHAPPVMQGLRRYVNPPPEPGPEVAKLLRDLLDSLWSIPLEVRDGVPLPRNLGLDPAAELAWATEMERLEPAYATASDVIAGVLGHARGRVLRLAGVLAHLRDANPEVVTGEDMERAIVCERYFIDHASVLLEQSSAQAEADRLSALEKRCQQILAKHPADGVSPRDLSQRVSKTRYSRADGRRRAVADLNAIGWSPRQPKCEARGRRRQVSWFPPRASTESTRGSDARRNGRSVDSVEPSRKETAGTTEPAAELLARASRQLLDREDVTLPRRGTRASCPICGSSRGLGVIPESPDRWYCHSDRHQAGGCAVDLYLGQRLGRQPSTAEAVSEAKAILGLAA